MRGICVCVFLWTTLLTVGRTQTWRGNYYRYYTVVGSERRWYCAVTYSSWKWCGWWQSYKCHYRTWCGRSSYYWANIWGYTYRCSSGWTHNGDYNCNIPVCSPSCRNGGTCSAPNTCSCPSWSSGYGCASLTCSYRKPCYPGDCQSGSSCTCEAGFFSKSSQDGCINMLSNAENLKPNITASNVTIANYRREDNLMQYTFHVIGADVDNTKALWSNQKRFNHMRFEFVTLFNEPELPKRPVYVHEGKIGIVQSSVEAVVSKLPARGRTGDRYIAQNKTHLCETGISPDNPKVEKDTCEINDDNFVTLIEHGDILTIRFMSRSGGYQKLINMDNQDSHWATKHYNGLTADEKLEFRFDFVVPEHCSQESGSCSKPLLQVDKEFTKSAITIRWDGWKDALSGVRDYIVEVFRLKPNRDERLVEEKPLEAEFTEVVMHVKEEMALTYTPNEPGMYSVLMRVSDVANNSRIARRFFLYDDTSAITLNDEKPLFVSSAVAETGYAWQMPSRSNDNKVNVSVMWKEHFINKVHHEGQLLAEIEKYPVQFEELEDDGILMSMKFVSDALDDNEGNRTRTPIANFQGIVKYEVVFDQSVNEVEPTTGWIELNPMKEEIITEKPLVDGDRLRVWVRATDVVGNTRIDSTFMQIDGSPPTVMTDSRRQPFEINVDSDEYKHASRVNFLASDQESGVHKLQIKIHIQTKGKDAYTIFDNYTISQREANLEHPSCVGPKTEHCFLPEQTVEIDNCWMSVNKDDLEISEAELEMVAYNQAMLSSSLKFKVRKLVHLRGLETYSGPTNMRIENESPTGFRLAWDIPETESCYGDATIVILLTYRDATGQTVVKTHQTPSTSTYYDFLALPNVQYSLGLKIQSTGGMEQDTGISLSVTTPLSESDGLSVGAIIGIVLGVIVLIIAVIVVLFILARRGKLNINRSGHD